MHKYSPVFMLVGFIISKLIKQCLVPLGAMVYRGVGKLSGVCTLMVSIHYMVYLRCDSVCILMVSVHYVMYLRCDGVCTHIVYSLIVC